MTLLIQENFLYTGPQPYTVDSVIINYCIILRQRNKLLLIITNNLSQQFLVLGRSSQYEYINILCIQELQGDPKLLYNGNLFFFWDNIWENTQIFHVPTKGQRELMFYMFKNLLDLFKRFVS